MIHIFHKWNRWSEPEEYQAVFIPAATGVPTLPYPKRRQRRTCATCGRVEERSL